MANLVPPSALPYLANTAAVIACIPTALGLGTLFRPQLCQQAFEFRGASKQATSQDRKLIDGLMTLFGVRDLAIGVTTLAIWYNLCRGGDTRGYQTLGTTMLVSGGMVLGDGWVSRQVNGGGEWKHWGFIPISTGLGLALLGLI